jgi:hypothetical protein
MAYRDDLEAAVERAETLERDLARARSELSHDHDRIADLERQLAEARKQQAAARTAPVEKPPSRRWMAMIGAALLLAAVGGLGFALQFGSPAVPPPSKPPKPLPTVPVQLPPGAFDVTAMLGNAVAIAQKELPDVKLLRIEAAFLDESGLAQLGFGGEVRYRFVSPSRARQPPPTAPVLGAPAVDNRLPCRVSVKATKDHELNASSPFGTGSECSSEEALPGAPRCTAAALWQKARQMGAPANALASVELRMSGGKARWHFTILDSASNQYVFDHDLPDDCP